MHVLSHLATHVIANYYAIKYLWATSQLYGNGMAVIQPAYTWLLKEQSKLPKSIVFWLKLCIFFSLSSAWSYCIKSHCTVEMFW